MGPHRSTEVNRSIQQTVDRASCGWAILLGGRCGIPRFARFAALAVVWMVCTVSPVYTANDDDAVRSISAALRGRHYQDALDLALAARRTSPKDVRILVLEGMALTGLRRDSEALAAFRTAMEVSPDYVPALEAAAEIEYRQGSPEATAHLQRLLALAAGRTNRPRDAGRTGMEAVRLRRRCAALRPGQDGDSHPARCASRVRRLPGENEAAGRGGGRFPAVDFPPAGGPLRPLFAGRITDGRGPFPRRDWRSPTPGARQRIRIPSRSN